MNNRGVFVYSKDPIISLLTEYLDYQKLKKFMKIEDPNVKVVFVDQHSFYYFEKEIEEIVINPVYRVFVYNCIPINFRIITRYFQLGVFGIFTDNIIFDLPQACSCINKDKVYYPMISINDLFKCIKEKKKMTSQENRIIFLLQTGMSYKEIAYELKLSLNTVKFYVNSIYRKLGIACKNDLKRIVELGGGL